MTPEARAAGPANKALIAALARNRPARSLKSTEMPAFARAFAFLGLALPGRRLRLFSLCKLGQHRQRLQDGGAAHLLPSDRAKFSVVRDDAAAARGCAEVDEADRFASD